MVGDGRERRGGRRAVLAQEVGRGRVRGGQQAASPLRGIGVKGQQATVQRVWTQALVGEIEQGDLDHAFAARGRAPAHRVGVGPLRRPRRRSDRGQAQLRERPAETDGSHRRGVTAAVEGAQAGQRQGAVVQAAGGDEVRIQQRDGLAQSAAGVLGSGGGRQCE